MIEFEPSDLTELRAIGLGCVSAQLYGDFDVFGDLLGELDRHDLIAVAIFLSGVAAAGFDAMSEYIQQPASEILQNYCAYVASTTFDDDQ